MNTSKIYNNNNLKKYVSEARDVGLEALKKKPKKEEYMAFESMLIFCLKKQINHAISILKLGNNCDTMIIARSMLELMFSMMWVASGKQEMEARAQRWNEYKCIFNYRNLLFFKKIERDTGYDEKKIIDQAEEYAKKYLPKKKVEQVKNATIEKHPFQGHWSGENIFNLAANLEDTESKGKPGESGKNLYYNQYFIFSEWAHSTSSLFDLVGENISSTHPEIFIKECDEPTLNITFLALHQINALFVEIFRIDELRNDVLRVKNEQLRSVQRIMNEQ